MLLDSFSSAIWFRINFYSFFCLVRLLVLFFSSHSCSCFHTILTANGHRAIAHMAKSLIPLFSSNGEWVALSSRELVCIVHHRRMATINEQNGEIKSPQIAIGKHTHTNFQDKTNENANTLKCIRSMKNDALPHGMAMANICPSDFEMIVKWCVSSIDNYLTLCFYGHVSDISEFYLLYQTRLRWNGREHNRYWRGVQREEKSECKQIRNRFAKAPF